MKMVRTIPWAIGSLYASWWTLIYFFADHAWWPIFLFYPLFPAGFLIEAVNDVVFHSWSPSSNVEYAMVDRIAGFNYLVCGFVWFFLIGRSIQWLVERVWGKHDAGRII